MTSTNPFIAAMAEIDRLGWAQGSDNVDIYGIRGPVCVGIALDNVLPDGQGSEAEYAARLASYNSMLADDVKSGCQGVACVSVAYHNDWHLKSREDAYVWLAKAAAKWESK